MRSEATYPSVEELQMKDSRTAEAALSALRDRVLELPLHGKRLDRIVDCDSGPPGLFTPPSFARELSVIHLRRRRGPEETLVTLCHELGHFWSYASSRRSVAYERALFQLTAWESSVSSLIRNADEVQRCGGVETAPDEVVASVRLRVLHKKPCPLTAQAQEEVIVEEGRAWWFGFEVAGRMAPESVVLLRLRASESLRAYLDRFGGQPAPWTPAAFSCPLDPDDKAYLVSVTAGV